MEGKINYKLLGILIAASLLTPSVRAYCNTTSLEVKRCIFKWACRGPLENISLPKSCKTNPTIDVYFRNVDETYFTNFNMMPNVQHIIRLDASKNGWPYLPIKLLEPVKKLQKLVLIGNNIASLPSKAFYYHHDLMLIDASYNKIKEFKWGTFKFHESHNKLSEIFLPHNQIKGIPDDLFVDLQRLKMLDLSYNQIEKLSQNSFRGLAALELLKLNNNNMISLNMALKDLTNLKHLFLRDNHFHHLDITEIPVLGKDLETFDLSRNVLSYVHPDLFKREAEKRLNDSDKNPRRYDIILSGNKIMTIENATFNDVILKDDVGNYWNATPTQIDLSSNIISEIEFNAFQGVSRLSELDLSKNKLTCFKVNTNNMNNLERLDLRGNHIHVILTESFTRLNRIKFVDFTENQIEYIPKNSFGEMRYIVALNMSNNQISEVKADSFGDLDFLNVLDLSSNHLKSVMLTKLTVPKLTNLILRLNEISSMSSVKLYSLLHLKYLDISLNRITNLDQHSLQHLKVLKRLDFGSNKIAAIQPSSFLSQKSLESLILRNNNLKNVEYGAFNGLQNLYELDLSYNKLTQIQSKIFYELKSLKILKLDKNEIFTMNLDIFRARPGVVDLSIGGNHLSCDWLTSTINEANHGWLHANLTAAHKVTAKTNVDGIQCEEKHTEKIVQARSVVGQDFDNNNNLLITNLEILKAIEKQTSSLDKDLKIIERLLQISNHYSFQNNNKTGTK